MASIKTKFTVGIFVIIGFSIGAVAMIWFGFYTQIEKGQFYIAYFDESVQGLNKDSPVKYRGVSVGRVDSVGVAPDSTLIQVILKIDPEFKPDENIIAQLRSVGITGLVFVELDRKQKEEPHLSPAIGFPSKYPVIVTKPSEMSKLFGSIEEALNKIKSFDVTGVSNRMKTTLDSIDQAVDDAQIKHLSTDIRLVLKKIDKAMGSVKKVGSSLNAFADSANEAVSDVKDTVLRVDRIIAENEMTVKKAIVGFDTSIEKANLLLDKGIKLVTDSNDRLSILQYHLVASLKNIEQASENLNLFVDLIADRPSRLIFGEPLPERQLEPDR